MATDQNQQIEIINWAFQSEDKLLHALGIYLWRRVSDIPRSSLILAKLDKAYRKLGLSEEEQNAEERLFSTFYDLFKFQLSPELPIHKIFPENTSPTQYLLDAIDADVKPSVYVTSIYDFTHYVLLFVVREKASKIKVTTIGAFEKFLDDYSQDNVKLLRELRTKVAKKARIEYWELAELKTQVTKLLAFNFLKIYAQLDIKIGDEMDDEYRKHGDKRDKIFISYSRKDAHWRDRLQTALAIKFRESDIVWVDINMHPGDLWKTVLPERLAQTKIAVLLVTIDFGGSNYINSVELPTILDAARKKELTLVWLSVGPCDYEHIGLSDFNCAHEPTNYIKDMSDSECEKILVETTKFIHDRYYGIV